MDIKVKDIGVKEEKSLSQKEEEVINNASEDVKETSAPVEQVDTSNESTTPTQEQESVQPESETQENITQSSELKEEDVLRYIKNTYDKDVSSVNDLFTEKEKPQELPEDVSAFLEYKKKTGRGFEDYVKLNRNFKDMDETQLLREYYQATEEDLDAEDIQYMMEDFAYDSEVDEENVIKKKKLAFKKEIGKARKFFEEQKEMYKEPLESSTATFSKEQEEQLEAYNQYVKDAQTYEEEFKRKRDWFLKKTDEVFDTEFKGFDFKVGEDKVITFLPSKDVEGIKKVNSGANALAEVYLDSETGLIKDASGYHRAISVARNPERFAKFFYEQGKAEATEDVMRKTKNVNMSERRTPEVTSKGGMKIKAVSSTSSRGLKIRSKRK